MSEDTKDAKQEDESILDKEESGSSVFPVSIGKFM
jgi:hypothetical protein